METSGSPRWDNGSGSGIGRITPAGAITEFTGPGSPGGITAGPDGALWFTEIAGDKIGRMTTAGMVTAEISIAAASATHEITTGPDGALWFAEAGKDQIGRIDPTTHTLTEFSTGITAGSAPFDIVSGRTGRCGSPRSTATRSGGSPPAASSRNSPSTSTSPVTVGPDGALW
jgi:streptogramin lyase